METSDDVGRALREHPFLAGMNEENFALIVGLAAHATFTAGQYIYREDQPADRFFLIRHGRVALEVHVPGQSPIIVETLMAGDPLGWSWLIPPYRSHFDARALELTRTISLDAKSLREQMEAHHSLGYDIHKRVAPVVAARLASARRQLIDLYGHPGEGGAAWR
jgi:CRP-like cAMP-binding protein